ncbi:MAG: phosphoribosylglycinamide formyltransferase [Synechococcus sp.]
MVGQDLDALVSPEPTTWPRFSTPLQLAVMASGSGSNFEALVTATQQQLDAQIKVLVVNNPNCGARHRADRLGVRCVVHDHRRYANREALDQALVSTFQQSGIEGVVMAGWMRIVTPDLIAAFPNRLINIHPSLLPSFRGLDAVGQALAAGVRISGCTAHVVTADVDTGPVIAQAAVPVINTDDHQSLSERIHTQEHRILPWAVALQGRDWRDQG